MKYRLGIDLGTHSIGWAILRLDTTKKPVEITHIINAGVRLYSDGRIPRSGKSLATQRRLPRGQRRRRDRFLRRKKAFMNALIRYGLMPEDEKERKALQQQNPYQLRAIALDQEITPWQLGRALFHLNQRRGFKSNRKANRAEKESGKIKTAIGEFQKQMGNSRTVGEALWKRYQQGLGTRARLRGTGKNAVYDFYVSREMILEEFDKLWEAQKKHHPQLLTDKAYEHLRDILSFQRPMKPAIVGKCTLNPEDKRAPRALPSAQQFRLYQEINNLRLIELATRHERPLKKDEHQQLITWLENRKEGKCEDARKQLFGKDNMHAFVFSIEQSGIKTKFPGSSTNSAMKSPKAMGRNWMKMDLAEQDAIIEKILETEDEEELVQWLIDDYQITLEQALYISNKMALEDGYFRLGRIAISRVLPQIKCWDDKENKPKTYDKAVKEAGYDDHRLQEYAGELIELPYYGEILWRYTQEMPNATNPDEQEYGRITNPTVHIGLNQLRKLINALIKKHGNPTQIHIELARELKQNAEQKRRTIQNNKLNRQRNEALDTRLDKEFHVKANTENRLRLRLYDELGVFNHQCVYTGAKIKATRLFTNDYQVEHILPWSRTLDDSYNNKVLVTRRANAIKADLSVKDYADRYGYQYEDILARTSKLPFHKAKRFQEDAYEQWLGNIGDFAEDGTGFLQRQLTDNAYISKVARLYLKAVCKDITVSPGRLTALIRGKWGLNALLSKGNRKNRDDHRHHALDAVMIAVIDRSLLQKIATLSAKQERSDTGRLLEGINDQMPWKSFRQDLAERLQRLIVSQRPDHNPQAQLHNETAYGIESYDEKKNIYLAHHRVPVAELKEVDLKELENQALAKRIKYAIGGLSKENFKQAIAKLPGKMLEGKIVPQKTRIQTKISGITVALDGTANSPFKGENEPQPQILYKTDSNYCYEIYETDKGTWAGVLITTFEANQSSYQNFMRDKKRYQTTAFNDKPLIMRLIKGDMLRIEQNGKLQYMQIQKFSKGEIIFTEHFEANVDSRNRDKKDPFSYTSKAPSKLQALKATRLFADILGCVKKQKSGYL